LEGTGDKVKIHAPAKVMDAHGHLGNFEIGIRHQENSMILQAGTIVFALETEANEKESWQSFEKFLTAEKDPSGFIRTEQGILNPLDSLKSGVFIIGKARDHLGEGYDARDGEAVASRVATVLAEAGTIRSPVVSRVVEENCDGCAYCIDPCPTDSLTLLEYKQRGSIKKVAESNDITCIGCGLCMSTCPKKGIFVKHFKLEYFGEMVKAAMEENDSQPVILSFCCNRCAYPGADSAGSSRIEYPTNVLIIRTVCSGMIHPNVIIDALTQTGADGVLLCGCHPGNCRSRNGILKAQARAEAIEIMLEDFALEQERFRIELIAASEGPKFARVIKEMTEELSALGPNPYR
jgi:coenzyme F420-reducing hydrogenase delta subunit/NAD-dependent dihydropyrimidine dehydrogenase PreA subunit